MGHVCDPARVKAVEDRRRAEALAIGASGVASEGEALDWEEALARFARSQAMVRGHDIERPPVKPIKRFGLTVFQWRVAWFALCWGSTIFSLGFAVGRWSR